MATLHFTSLHFWEPAHAAACPIASLLHSCQGIERWIGDGSCHSASPTMHTLSQQCVPHAVSCTDAPLFGCAVRPVTCMNPRCVCNLERGRFRLCYKTVQVMRLRCGRPRPFTPRCHTHARTCSTAAVQTPCMQHPWPCMHAAHHALSEIPSMQCDAERMHTTSLLSSGCE